MKPLLTVLALVSFSIPASPLEPVAAPPVGGAIGQSSPRTAAPDRADEGLEFCFMYPEPQVFELWVRNGSATNAGLAGFSMAIQGQITDWRFDRLLLETSEAVSTTGFDVLGSGYVKSDFNIYGVQTARSPNKPLFDLSQRTVVASTQEGDVQFKSPLRLGVGRFTGNTVPVLIATELAGNSFELSRTGQTAAAAVGSCCGAASGDEDGDGLPDCWEHKYFGSGTSAAANDDTDEDGHTNYREYIAGTDPLLSISRFVLTSIRHSDGVVELAFPTAPFREYQVEYTSQLDTSDDWTPFGSRWLGDGRSALIWDTDPGDGTRFYRVLVLKP